MIPLHVDGLIVPVATSTTHVAYSSIRMEPTWMAPGQVAGAVAALSIEYGGALRYVPIPVLQKNMKEAGQILEPALEACY
ncbi:MAG: FAD-dependent oxidoreductase [Verrucomicrobiales bacterium]|nr:FAD-dependent oxidoreductase [Verrucomicrobiales bacterium]